MHPTRRHSRRRRQRRRARQRGPPAGSPTTPTRWRTRSSSRRWGWCTWPTSRSGARSWPSSASARRPRNSSRPPVAAQEQEVEPERQPVAAQEPEEPEEVAVGRLAAVRRAARARPRRILMPSAGARRRNGSLSRWPRGSFPLGGTKTTRSGARTQPVPERPTAGPRRRPSRSRHQADPRAAAAAAAVPATRGATRQWAGQAAAAERSLRSGGNSIPSSRRRRPRR